MAPRGPDHKQRQKEQWSAAADGWNRRFEWYTAAFGPLTAWCCHAAGVAPGIRLLDVACGTGLVALAAAAGVQPGGRVIAIDISPYMVAVARRRADAAGLDAIDILEMDAEHLRLGDGSFDAVTCACGLMFVPDALGAVREMHRVLRPGGRLALAVWDEPAKSSFMTLAGQAVAAFFPPAPPSPGAPGGFRFARPGELAGLLRQGGFCDVATESCPLPIDCASTSEYWEIFTDMAAGLKAKLASLPPHDLVRLRAMVDESAARYQRDGRLRLVATPLCASGRKP